MARMSSIPPDQAPLRSRPAAALRTATALEPLSVPVFRLLWSTWLVANLCMWMTDVAAAWTMTTLTSTPIWVALVQSASTLPVFLLGLPSGALADILDRRRWLMATQFWLAATAAVLCAVTAARADDRALAAGARLRQRHRPGAALAGVLGDRSGAGAESTSSPRRSPSTAWR